MFLSSFHLLRRETDLGNFDAPLLGADQAVERTIAQEPKLVATLSTLPAGVRDFLHFLTQHL